MTEGLKIWGGEQYCEAAAASDLPKSGGLPPASTIPAKYKKTAFEKPKKFHMTQYDEADLNKKSCSGLKTNTA